MKRHVTRLLPLIAALALPATTATAAWTFDDGDLVLAFQATSGQGQAQNLYFNLGSAAGFRDNGGQGTLGNIQSDLVAIYGADWYNRDNLWFGVFGNYSNAPLITNPAPVNGDPSVTLYASRAASVPGASATWSFGGSASMNSAATQFAGTKTVIQGLVESAFGDGAALLDQGLDPVGWNNSWSVRNPTPGAAFGSFTGGIQNNFGKGDAMTLVDVQRILATTTGADPTGSLRTGDYITSIVIGPDGSITAIPEPSTGLLALGAGLCLALRRRRSSAA